LFPALIAAGPPEIQAKVHAAVGNRACAQRLFVAPAVAAIIRLVVTDNIDYYRIVKFATSANATPEPATVVTNRETARLQLRPRNNRDGVGVCLDSAPKA
jgi:hypothetical protein